VSTQVAPPVVINTCDIDAMRWVRPCYNASGFFYSDMSPTATFTHATVIKGLFINMAPMLRMRHFLFRHSMHMIVEWQDVAISQQLPYKVITVTA